MGLLELLGAALVAVIGAFFYGKRTKKKETALEAAERYAKTRKAMDDAANEVVGDDPAALREWLRERGKSGGDL